MGNWGWTEHANDGIAAGLRKVQKTSRMGKKKLRKILYGSFLINSLFDVEQNHEDRRDRDYPPQRSDIKKNVTEGIYRRHFLSSRGRDCFAGLLDFARRMVADGRGFGRAGHLHDLDWDGNILFFEDGRDAPRGAGAFMIKRSK